MTFRDRARDPIALLIAALIGLVLGIVLAIGGVPVVWAILAGFGLAAGLFALNVKLDRPKLDQPKPELDSTPEERVDTTSDSPASRAVEMFRKSAGSYADIVASTSARDGAGDQEVTQLVTAAREVVDLVGQYAAMVAADERCGIAPDKLTEQASTKLELGEHWLTSAAAAADEGRYDSLHVQSLRATGADLSKAIDAHAKGREGTAGGA
jgi:hypothetical protein